MRNKKGELTTQQIVTLIILIISFGVILFLLVRLNLGDTTNDEICHNSVLLQKSKLAGGPFDCRTGYGCMSGGGDCVSFNYEDEIEVNDASNKTKIVKAIAEEMASCWWMFGEGEVDYVGYSWKLDVLVGKHCAICNVIKFDEQIQDANTEISYEELYQYLELHEVKEGETYLEYLYGVSSTDNLGDKINGISLGDAFSLNDKFSIITGMKEEENYINPLFIKSSEITSKTECDVLDITKA